MDSGHGHHCKSYIGATSIAKNRIGAAFYASCFSCLSQLFYIHLSSLLEMLNFCGLDCYLIPASKVISDCSELGSKCSQWHSHLTGGVEFPEQLLHNINPTKSKLFKTRRQCPALPPLSFARTQYPSISFWDRVLSYKYREWELTTLLFSAFLVLSCFEIVSSSNWE